MVVFWRKPPSRAATDIVKTQPPPSSYREVLAGLVERVTYQNAENGFGVIRVKARGHRDLICDGWACRDHLGGRMGHGFWWLG